MKPYPSIEQFRNIIKAVKTNHDYQGKDEEGKAIYRHTSPYPVITFKGNVKLHGTNAAVVKYKDGSIKFQSRERELRLTSDNYGFMMNMLNKQLDFLFDKMYFEKYVAVYGEWAGQGVQNGVSISELPKAFYIFGCKVDDQWIPYSRKDESQKIYNLDDYNSQLLSIDFNYPERSQNTLIERTQQVENCCPVAKILGNVDGIGEGIVWSAQYGEHFYQFKVKGEKHSVTRVKTPVAMDVEQIENIQAFIDYALTPNRLKQGIIKMQELEIPLEAKSTRSYIQWVMGDIIKEEQDTIVQNQINVKKLGGICTAKIREYWFQQLDQLAA